MIARGAPTISHLFFADDNLIFVKADTTECQSLALILSSYEKTSGQVVNFEKSSIMISQGTRSNVRRQNKDVLKIRSSEEHQIYLGLPVLTVKRKKVQFSYIIDRVRRKMDNWKNRMFSEGGREILIKAVIQSVSTYDMQCFRLPTSVCSEIERLTRNFWWTANENKKGVCCNSWDNLCKKKLDGGLGFRRLVEFNKVLLAKQVWRILVNPELLVSKVYKARYFKNEDILEAGIGNNPSFIWRSLHWSRGIIDKGCCWRVGNGQKTYSLRDKWIERMDNGKPIRGLATNSKIATYIGEDGRWNRDLLQIAFLPTK